MDYIKENLNFYKENNTKYGEGSLKNLWTRKKSQIRRFKKFLNHLDFNNKSVLDVGCGYGDFFHYALEKNIKIDKYIGCELMEEHCKIARQYLPEKCQIIQGDFLIQEFKKVDISILSGTLNLEFEKWLLIAEKMLNKMWDLSNEAIAFNMQSPHGLSGNYKKKVEASRNINPEYWCKYAHSKAFKYGLYHDYMHYDYTVIMWKKNIGWQENEESD